jgi:cytosine deaminase/tRNA(adenine34) deaminase
MIPEEYKEIIDDFLKELESTSFVDEEIPSLTMIYTKNTNQYKKITSNKNHVQTTLDTTLHSEMLAIQEAEKVLNSRYLSNSILITTLEPCLMCAGAIIGARIGTIIYFVEQSRFPGISSYPTEIIYRLNHFPKIYFLEEERISERLKLFFRSKR